ncbi:O-antigen ligase family protein [Vreelandella sulfidaeris]
MQTGRAGQALSLLNGIIIFVFAATLILIPEAYWWLGLAAFISSLIGCAVFASYKLSPRVFTGDDYKLVVALVFFGSVWWWSVLADDSLPLLARDGVHHLYLWPFLAAFFLLALRTFTPSPYWLWWGVCCGALGSGMIAIYERVIIGVGRASNGINAIPFGNLSLLTGALSVVASIYWLQQRKTYSFGFALLAVCAAFFGFLASLLSGTRGGWVAIPFLTALMLSATTNLISSKVRNVALLLITIFVIFIIAYPASGIWLRLVAIFDDIYQYFINNNADTSLGTRFEFWRAGWIMFIENPILGIGEGGIQERLESLVAHEIASDRGMTVPQLHSDIIDTLARRGLLGVISLLLLYVGFASAFAKKALHANDNVRSRLLAISGLMVIIGFFDFGLSQAMFRDLRGFSGFLGFSVAVWGCLGYKTQAQPVSTAPRRTAFLR